MLLRKTIKIFKREINRDNTTRFVQTTSRTTYYVFIIIPIFIIDEIIDI